MNPSHTRMSLRKNPFLLLGVSLLICICLFALIAPMLSSHTYFDTHLIDKNLPPCQKFWFGTDELGRDLWTRTACGAQISLLIGILASCIDLVIGFFFGATAALLGGKKEEVCMRLADILHTIPRLLLVICLMVIMGNGFGTILMALASTGWMKMARIVRGQTKQIIQMDFVKAAIALGACRKHLLLFHILPNCMSCILLSLTLTIPYAIFSEAFLSFLGLGIQAPIASLGSMITDGLSALRVYPWRLFFPSAFIFLTLLSFYLISEGLRDAFDPRTHI